MQDKFDGIGGSYLADPKTGKRKLMERTSETLQPAVEAEASATPPEE